MKRITTRTDFVELAKELGVRRDWHEQEVTAEIDGSSFDNAGFWPRDAKPFMAPEIVETHVIISQRGEPVAAVNLATLCAWASGLEY